MYLIHVGILLVYIFVVRIYDKYAMKLLYILYIGVEQNNRSKELASYLVRLLSARCQVHLVGSLFNTPSQELRKSYDLILIQNSFSLIHYKKLLKQYIKCPVLFIAATQSLDSYVAPFENLFGVLNIEDTSLSALGIPEEMQLCLYCPVEKTGNYYFYEQQPKVCRIVYCPTGNSIIENDVKLLTFLQQTNTSLTIVSDEYLCLKQALPPFVTIVSRSSWFSVYKKAHLIVASRQDVVRALALCKPCVVMGDYGLGGLVTSENYVQLQSVYFRGRKGGCFGELVPAVLLESEIRKVFAFDSQIASKAIQKHVLSTYGKKVFSEKIIDEIERITNLAVYLNKRQKRLSLKPCLSSMFELKAVEGKQYLMRGLNCFGELDQEMIELLKQCDGTVSVQDLAGQNGYDREDVEILWANLYELWKEKLILFAL